MKTYILYIDKELSRDYASECRDSANKFNLDIIMHEGLCGKQNRELTRMTGLNIRTVEYASEYCGTVGHFQIWKQIAKSGEIGVVLEHDCVVMGDYSNLTVNDGEILFLGPRLFDRSQYVFPTDSEVNYHDVGYYNGAHAYAITANTAASLLAELDRTKTILMPIDGLLGLKNKFNMKLKTVDPSFVISEIGNHRKSFNFDQPDITNRYYFPKFLSGVVDQTTLPPIAEYKFTVDWFSRHIPHWFKTFKLLNIDINQPLSILEIGAYEGKSTCWISDNMLTHLDSCLDVVDTFQGSIEHIDYDNSKLYEMFVNNISLSRNPEKIKTHTGDSRIFLPIFIKENRKYDFIYVDGAHMPENIIIDGMCCYHLLKDNGVIIFDDYDWDFETFDNRVDRNLVKTEKPVKIGLDILETLVPIDPILTDYQRSYVKK
jgi:predicted O-methyltransferase YrrM